jgi:hypothetical protein
MLLKKVFFFYNFFVSCLILFLPLYEFSFSKNELHFLCYYVLNFINFCAYCCILYYNINYIYLNLNDDKVGSLNIFFNKIKKLEYTKNMIDLLYFSYFFKLKLNEFLFFFKI